jgi:sugar phosphate isomerase/epimerase
MEEARVNEVSRREFLGTAAAGSALAAAGCASAPATGTGAAGAGKAQIEIGVNLEFVRHADKSFEFGAVKASELGYKYIEPCFLMGTCLLSAAGYCHVQSLDLDPQYFKDLCGRQKLKISGLSSHSDLLDTRVGVEYARKGIMYARALADRGLFDTPPVVQICETMFPPKWMTPDDAFAIMKMNLRPIMECCQDNGVYLGVEPHGPYTAKKDRMLRILDLNNSPWLRVNFDTGNSFLAGEDPYLFLEAVKDKVVHVHAKDIGGTLLEERGKLSGTPVGCACGDGAIDWKKVCSILSSANYKGVLSVECGTVEQAAKSLKHLKQVLGK